MKTTHEPDNDRSLCKHGLGPNCPHCEDDYTDRLMSGSITNPDAPRLSRARPVRVADLFLPDADLGDSNNTHESFPVSTDGYQVHRG